MRLCGSFRRVRARPVLTHLECWSYKERCRRLLIIEWMAKTHP